MASIPALYVRWPARRRNVRRAVDLDDLVVVAHRDLGHDIHRPSAAIDLGAQPDLASEELVLGAELSWISIRGAQVGAVGLRDQQILANADAIAELVVAEADQQIGSTAVEQRQIAGAARTVPRRDRTESARIAGTQIAAQQHAADWK